MIFVIFCVVMICVCNEFSGLLLLGCSRSRYTVRVRFCCLFLRSQSLMKVTQGISGFQKTKLYENFLRIVGGDSKHTEHTEPVDLCYIVSFYCRLSEELYQKDDDSLNGIFRPYIERLINSLCRHCQMEPDIGIRLIRVTLNIKNHCVTTIYHNFSIF